jgi:hypothetical protein
LRATHTGVQAISTVTGLQTALDNKADLVAGVVPQNQLPSYVDDVLEFVNLASFPATGEIGKIYIALDSNKQYRWSGTIYIQITNGLIASTSDVPEGSNLYFTGARVLATVLSGISFITNRAVVATDSVLVALGLLQKQVSDKLNLTGGTLTGALTINVDSFINGLRIGRGGGNQSSNTANGGFALNANTTGSNNTANGAFALNANTEGSNNTANGSSALQNNTTGSLNTANGVLALFSNTTGFNNTANGTSALIANTIGSANTAIGQNALLSNTTGSNNTANGINSGSRIADGITANTISNESVFLGNNTKALANNQTNQIVIGDNATGAGSNTVTLGNTSITSTILRGTVTAPTFVGALTGTASGNLPLAGGTLTGHLNIGNLSTTIEYFLDIPSNSETWVNIGTFSNRFSAQIQTQITSSSSEEESIIDLLGTYFNDQTNINVKRQTYTSPSLLEVRVTGTEGNNQTVFIRTRSNGANTSLRFRVISSRGLVSISNTITTAQTGGAFYINNNTRVTGMNTDLDVVGNGKFSGSINSGSITANGIITGNQIASVSGITGANIRITAIPEYADNAAALANFEPIGRFYRTGDILKVVH